MALSTNRFVNNLGFYTIGTFATKLLQFLLIPVYSKYICPEDLGTFNIIIATLSLALPILFQSIYEGTFRFAIENEDKIRSIIATGSKYCMTLSILYSVIFMVTAYLIDLNLSFYILLYGIGQVGTSYWQYSARALKENKIYAISSFVNSVVAIALNLILIICFNNGLKSLLISNTMGCLIMTAMLEYKLKLIKDINKYPFDAELLKNIIKYSMPLAINLIAWWLFASCNNFIVTGVLGSDSNGIYGIALRFGMILTTISSIFTMAWNEEAFRIYKDNDRDEYFNKMLDVLIRAFMAITIVLIPITYIAYQYFVFGEYRNGVSLTPLIYLSSVFNAFACHLGSALLSRKESDILFRTTLISGLLSVLVAFITLKYVGLIGAALSTFIANALNFYIRIPILKKRINIQYNAWLLILLTVFCIVENIVCAIYQDSLLINCLILIIASVFVFDVNKQLVVQLFTEVKKRIIK